MLVVDDISVRFGRRVALNQVRVNFPEKGVVALVGPNGAGKSTLLDVLSGFLSPQSGSVRDSTGKSLCRSSLAGLTARLHQKPVIPAEVSVQEFINVAMEPRRSACMTAWRIGQKTTQNPRQMKRLHRIKRVLLLAGLGEERYGSSLMGRLSWGQARLVATCAIMLAPKRDLLLDEPFAGLSRSVSNAVKDLVLEEARRRLVVLVEHDLDIVREISNKVVFLVSGNKQGEFDGRSLDPLYLLRHFGG